MADTTDEKPKKSTVTETLLSRLESGVPKIAKRDGVYTSSMYRDILNPDDYIYNIPPQPLLAPKDFLEEVGEDLKKEDDMVVPALKDGGAGHHSRVPVMAHDEDTTGHYTHTPPAKDSNLQTLFDTYESTIEDLKSRLLAKEEDKAPCNPQDAAHASLIAIVDTFNNQMIAWYKETGCVVNFGWQYSRQKLMEILGIDYIVFRKEAPSEKTLSEVLKNPPK